MSCRSQAWTANPPQVFVTFCFENKAVGHELTSISATSDDNRTIEVQGQTQHCKLRNTLCTAHDPWSGGLDYHSIVFFKHSPRNSATPKNEPLYQRLRPTIEPFVIAWTTAFSGSTRRQLNFLSLSIFNHVETGHAVGDNTLHRIRSTPHFRHLDTGCQRHSTRHFSGNRLWRLRLL